MFSDRLSSVEFYIDDLIIKTFKMVTPRVALFEFGERDRILKESSKVGYALLKVNTAFWDVIRFPEKTYRGLSANIRCRRNKTHVLRTREGRPGEWYDLCERIPDALLTAVVDFVEVECSHMTVWCANESLRKEYKAMIKADPSVRAKLGIDWLSFQATSDIRDEEGRTAHERIIGVYKFAKETKPFWDSAYDYKDYQEITRLEKEYDEKMTHFLKEIIELRKYLWT